LKASLPLTRLRYGSASRTRFGLWLGVAVLSTALAGCGGSAPATFDLTAPTSGIGGRATRAQILIAEPNATSPVDGDRIVVRTGPESVAYLTGAQWAERLPRLVQTRMIQTFENGKSLRSVGRVGDKMVADSTLTTEIRRFEIDVTSGQAVVEMSAKLVGEMSGRVVAAKIFSASAPGSASDGANAAAALDAALASVLRQIVVWTTARG
jgi:cholesterol transport system auxiliary component